MSFSTGLSGLQAAQKTLDSVGDAIANVDTKGYKQVRTEFSDVIAASQDGASSTTVGSGVRLAAVTQQFTQGTASFTDNNLDMMINGNGFFILDDAGATVYSRTGAFGTDKDGVVVNASGQKLQGFLADSLGSITGAQGDMVISNANLPPQQTTATTAAFNLDSTKTEPSTTWVGSSFFGNSAPSPSTYNSSTSTTIYDSLGNSHVLSMYFIKTATPNNWDMRTQIDGVEVSTTTAKANSTDSSASSLTTSGLLTTLASGDLTLNGTSIGAAASDGVSTTDDTASSIATVAAINALTGTHGVTAAVNSTTFNLGAFTAGTLSSTDFQINGQNVVVATASTSALLTAINALTGTTGVSAATNATGEVVLTASDGRNIQLEADGTAVTSSFVNFALNTARDQVQRGTFTLTSTSPITIAGSSPTDVGLTNRIAYPPYRLVFDTNGAFNGTLSETVDISWTPLDANGSPIGAVSPQSFTVDLANTTQYGSAFAVQSLTQDGYATGQVSGIDVDTSGVIFARYSNGQSLALGQVALANFANPQGLQRLGDNTWGETFSSGSSLIGGPGTASLGLVQGGALENSNVELSDKLVELLEAQRNFQANAQTIQTNSTIDQTLLNIG